MGLRRLVKKIGKATLGIGSPASKLLDSKGGGGGARAPVYDRYAGTPLSRITNPNWQYRNFSEYLEDKGRTGYIPGFAADGPPGGPERLGIRMMGPEGQVRGGNGPVDWSQRNPMSQGGLEWQGIPQSMQPSAGPPPSWIRPGQQPVPNPNQPNQPQRDTQPVDPQMAQASALRMLAGRGGFF